MTQIKDAKKKGKRVKEEEEERSLKGKEMIRLIRQQQINLTNKRISAQKVFVSELERLRSEVGALTTSPSAVCN